MTFLGLRDGVRLQFDGGVLSGIDMSRFGRTFELHEEFAAAPGPLGEPLPYLPLEASLDISEAHYRGLDPYSGFQVHQSLAAGQRTISILQGQTIVSSGLLEPLLARAHVDISLSAPLTWRLRAGVDATWESDESGVEAYLGKGCTVRLSSTVPLAMAENGRALEIDLPTGSSTIEMWIEAQAPVPLAPAVIICTPGQMREAAVVASAIGSKDRSYIPILDVDLPPMSTSDVQSAQARLSQLNNELSQLEQQMETVAQRGAQAPSGIILPGAKPAEQSLENLEQQRDSLLRDMDPLQQRIVTYASWARRSSVLTRLIGALTAGAKESPLLAVLAPYPADLLVQWAATAEMVALFPQGQEKQADAWQKTMQGVVPAERLEIVIWSDIQDLARHVWRRVHGLEQPAFFTIPDDPAFFPIGLIDALRRGRALLPKGRPGSQVNIEQIQDGLNAGNTSTHAVVVEPDGSVSSLIGALYAYHSGARFYVNPAPHADQVFDKMRVITESVQREQLAAMAANAYRYIGEHRKQFMQSQGAEPQLKQIAAGLTVLELPAAVPTPYSDQAFVQALTTYLTAQQSGAQQGYRYDDSQWTKDLAALEAEASAGVSAHTRQAIAECSHVTAFTGGLPYGLAAGFEGKAVGLVLHDLAAPLILRVVAQANSGRPALTLALNLDPGLQQRPAPDVPGAMDRTITLRGPAASLSNLAVLAGLLPLDAILLHTQGNLDSIILGDARNRLVEVHTSEFTQQVRMGSLPLVIYTAPLAWLGLGVALLEQGAGGFVGTMWPVGDAESEDAVSALLAAVVAKGQNPAEAVHSLPSFDPRTARAYVYLGTATQQPTPGVNVQDGAPLLYALAARLASSGRSEIATLVYDRLRALTGEMAAADPALRAQLILLDADFQVRLAGRKRERPAQDTLDKIAQSLEQLDKISLSEEQKKDLQIAIQERAALMESAAQNYDRAQELFTSVRSARHARGQIAGELAAAYQLAVVQERQRQWAASRATLLSVQQQLGQMGNAVGMVMVATSLAYVSLPLAMYPDVLGHLKMAIQAGMALGAQLLSESLVQTLSITRAMAQMGATADLITLAHTLAGVIRSDKTMPEVDRTSIAGIFSLIEETAKVLQAGLPTEEREAKLAALVEKAQENELAHSLGMDAWILGAGSPAEKQEEEGTETAT